MAMHEHDPADANVAHTTVVIDHEIRFDMSK